MQHIYILSDATGETVERVLRAALSQFTNADIKLHRLNRLRTRQDVEQALDEVLKNKGIMIYTLVNPDLAQFLRDQAVRNGLDALDLITPLILKLSEFLCMAPQEKPGLLHQLNADYNRRVEAVNFAVKQDDGQEPRNLDKADIVLVGVSRTSKTPLSMYLANKGFKVANIPLVEGIEPPRELFEIDPQKVVGLVIDGKRLAEIRSNRLRHLMQSSKGSYADFQRIEEELEFSRTLFRKHPEWLVIDVTKKAIEETATEILKKRNGS